MILHYIKINCKTKDIILAIVSLIPGIPSWYFIPKLLSKISFDKYGYTFNGSDIDSIKKYYGVEISN